MHIRAKYEFLFLCILLSACSIEQKLAKTFATTKPIGEFLLLEPDVLFKSNLKTWELDGYDTMDEYTRDSLLLQKSLFLKDVADTAVIHQFVDGFRQTLEKYGCIVLPASSVDTVMANGGHPYILNLAQFSLEEYVHPYSAEQQMYDQTVVIDGFDVNAINYNIWIELGRLNSENANKVLFSSDYLTDEVDGTFRQNIFTGSTYFDYTIDTIKVDQVYTFAKSFGRRTAAMIFDYLMNEYMINNLPSNYPYEPYYYHYNPDKKLLYTINEEDRIIVLDK